MINDIYHPDFIDNKYKKLYFKIIENRRCNNFLGYTEKHHIIPRSIGGLDISDNFVKLSAREHFICHYLLKKFTRGQSYYKMVCAFKAMCELISQNTSLRYVNSFLFEKSRLEYKDVLSERMKEHSPFKNPEIHAKTMKTREERGTNVFVTNNPMHNEEIVRKKLESMPDMKGRKCWFNTITQERKQQIDMPEGDGWILRGHKYGLQTKAKGKPKRKRKCPYCDFHCAPHLVNKHIKAKHGKN